MIHWCIILYNYYMQISYRSSRLHLLSPYILSTTEKPFSTNTFYLLTFYLLTFYLLTFYLLTFYLLTFYLLPLITFHCQPIVYAKTSFITCWLCTFIPTNNTPFSWYEEYTYLMPISIYQ